MKVTPYAKSHHGRRLKEAIDKFGYQRKEDKMAGVIGRLQVNRVLLVETRVIGMEVDLGGFLSNRSCRKYSLPIGSDNLSSLPSRATHVPSSTPT